MWIADELDDYAEIPDDSDPISHITKFDTSQNQVIPQKKKYPKYFQKVTSNYPKYSPDFNFKAISKQIFEGKIGDLIAKYLNRPDIARLLSTCRYFNKVFSRNHIWLSSLVKSYGCYNISSKEAKLVNIGQYYRYFRYHQCDGILFDTDSLRKDMKPEDKPLVGHIVDFVKITSVKTKEVIKMLAFKGTLTEDLKISWIKDLNQVCVWVAGFHVQNKRLSPSVCTLYSKRYEEGIKDVFFLNDRYFVVEIEDSDTCRRTFEIFLIEPEADWFEKKEINLCKQVHKESFAVVDVDVNIKIKNIGDFLIFISGMKSDVFVKVLNMKEGNKVIYESKELHLESCLSDVIIPKITKGNLKELGFNIYILDQGLEVYMLNFTIDTGIILKRIDVEKPEEKKEAEPDSTWVAKQLRACRAPVRSLNHWNSTNANDERFALAV